MAKCLLYKNIAAIFSIESKGNYNFQAFNGETPSKPLGSSNSGPTQIMFCILATPSLSKKNSCHRIKLLFLIRSFIRTQKKQTRRTFSQLKHDNLVKHVFLLNPFIFPLLSSCIQTPASPALGSSYLKQPGPSAVTAFNVHS